MKMGFATYITFITSCQLQPTMGEVTQHNRRYNIFQFPNINIINVVKEGDIYVD
jgi:hypothetical protein